MEALKRRCIGALVLGVTLGSLPVAAVGPANIMLTPMGKVEVRAQGQNVWEKISRVTPLFPGQEVRTGESSSAQIVFSDGSKVELSPNAEFAVEDASSKESRFNLKLGKLRAYFTVF